MNDQRREGPRILRSSRWLTLGACVSLAVLTVAIGLAALRIVPASPPDAAFAERAAKWRALSPPPR